MTTILNNKHTIRNIKKEIMITELAQELGLKLSGKKTQCPFHSDSNPSFTLYPETNSFNCFGCGESGSVIDLYMKMKNLDFLEAAKELAVRAGKTWQEVDAKDKQKQEEELIKLYELDKWVKYFGKST